MWKTGIVKQTMSYFNKDDIIKYREVFDFIHKHHYEIVTNVGNMFFCKNDVKIITIMEK